MTRVFLWFGVAFLLVLVAVRVIWGGGNRYPDVNTQAALTPDVLEVMISYPEPIGNVAVADNGDVFFTVHPASRPEGNRMLRYREGLALPFPDGAAQQNRFTSPLGLTIDNNGHLWTIDHGKHGTGEARLQCFDTVTGDVLVDYLFDEEQAPLGSYLQDLVVSTDGQTVVVADASVLRKQPALLVFDVASRTARRVLEGHPSIRSQDWAIHNNLGNLKFYAGMVSLMPGVDGLAIDPTGEWLYYAAMSHDGLFRVPLSALRDTTLDEQALATSVERYSDKPLSDGLAVDRNGDFYLPDIEHHAIMSVGANRQLQTVIQSPQLRWPGSISFDNDGQLYVADSALPLYVMKSRDAIKTGAPYHIFRFRPGAEGTTGQ